jgi:hypothetical protein
MAMKFLLAIIIALQSGGLLLHAAEPLQSPALDLAPTLFEAKNARRVVISYCLWSACISPKQTVERIREHPLIRVEFLESYAWIYRDTLIDALVKSSPHRSENDPDLRCLIDMYDAKGKLVVSFGLAGGGHVGIVQGIPVEMSSTLKDTLSGFLNQMN